MRIYSTDLNGEQVEVSTKPVHLGLKKIKYYEVICEKCRRKIGESVEEPTYAVCLDCYKEN